MDADLVQHLEDLGVDLAHIDDGDILTGAQAAEAAGVSRAAITQWRQRGYIGPDKKRVRLRNIGTEDRPRYLRVDVAKAERDTRRPGVVRKRVDIAAYQMNEHWDRINPEESAA
ncbi:hypothetical protein OG216_09740 [Streptomycetaceae bacterium NBC_01309]